MKTVHDRDTILHTKSGLLKNHPQFKNVFVNGHLTKTQSKIRYEARLKRRRNSQIAQPTEVVAEPLIDFAAGPEPSSGFQNESSISSQT